VRPAQPVSHRVLAHRAQQRIGGLPETGLIDDPAGDVAVGGIGQAGTHAAAAPGAGLWPGALSLAGQHN
jgi:hypothetical protein